MTRTLPLVPRSPLEAARTTLVADIMTHDPITVGPETGIEEVMGLFVARELSHVPVVDDKGRAIGMISKTDIVRDVHLRGDTQVHQGPGSRARGARSVPAGHVHEADDVVRNVMTPIALWVPATASVAEAAKVIASGQLHALVVADKDRRVIGIVSAFDLAAWVAGVDPRART